MRLIDESCNVLVTGATGFVGRSLIAVLLKKRVRVTVLTRDASRVPDEWRSSAVDVREADLLNYTAIRGVCEGVTTVLHLASPVESFNDTDGKPDLHWPLSVDGTRALLEGCERARVSGFVYISSVKTMGEVTEGRVDETAKPRPVSTYGEAKLAAEGMVLDAGRRLGIRVCVLRLPMVYGPNPKGSLIRMIAAIDRGRFPPLPEVHNKRSMVHVDDVVRALLLAAETPAANGQVYIVTDGRAYSAREIYCAIAQALGRGVPHWTVPEWVLRFGAKVGDTVGRVAGRSPSLSSAALEKLLGSAWYSSDKIHRELGFVPRRSLYDALPEMVTEYRTREVATVSTPAPSSR